MGLRPNPITLALSLIPFTLLTIDSQFASAAPLDAKLIPEAGTGFFYMDLEAVRENRLGEMFAGSRSFQRDYGNLPIGKAEVHRSVRSILATIDDEGTFAAMVTVVGPAEEWLQRVSKRRPDKTTESGLAKYNDRNAHIGRLMGQIGRSKKNGELFVTTRDDRVFLAGTEKAITDWMQQLKANRPASWLEHAKFVEAPIMCVRRTLPEQSGFSHVAIDTVGPEIRIRVEYNAKSEAMSGLLAMLKPEVVGKMLTAMQQQSEAKQAQAKKEAAEIAAVDDDDQNDSQTGLGNHLNISMGFQGNDGLNEAIEFLRNTFDVDRQGLKLSIQWQGLLDLEYDHTAGSEHVYSFQFTARVKEQLEIAARKKTNRTR